MRFRQSLAALAFVALASAQQVPRPAGKFAIGTTDGNQILPSQYSGKVVLLAFMFTTCPHCQHTSQILSGIQGEYGDRGLQILGAFFNENAAQLIPGFIAQFHPAFPVGYATRDQVNEYLEHSLVKPTYVPELVFIDRNGQIRGQFTGTDDFFKDQETSIRNLVESLLKEPVTAKKTAHSAHKKQS
ncbi:MAG TPA: TlpA disulfide reductase family protein [Bryobacteraceae bacterium]|nr:TlpA disulfide reductase family protein [Bryobacteraceae bacterium]